MAANGRVPARKRIYSEVTLTDIILINTLYFYTRELMIINAGVNFLMKYSDE